MEFDLRSKLSRPRNTVCDMDELDSVDISDVESLDQLDGPLDSAARKAQLADARRHQKRCVYQASPSTAPCGKAMGAWDIHPFCFACRCTNSPGEPCARDMPCADTASHKFPRVIPQNGISQSEDDYWRRMDAYIVSKAQACATLQDRQEASMIWDWCELYQGNRTDTSTGQNCSSSTETYIYHYHSCCHDTHYCGSTYILCWSICGGGGNSVLTGF